MEKHNDNPLVYVDDSPIHGKGLYAAEPIAREQKIGTYAGTMTTEDGTYVLWIEEDDGSWIGCDGKNSMRFLNHADKPNAEMDGLECYAIEDIAAGQEVTIDYGWNESDSDQLDSDD